MKYEIRELTRDDLSPSAGVVLEAFNEMAVRFGFEPDPDDSRLLARLTDDLTLRARMFGAFLHGIQVGFVEIDEKDEEVYEIRQLAVLPDYQRQGCGQALLDRAEAAVREMGGVGVVGAVIGENQALIDWLISRGYYEEASGSLHGVPCRVCLMQKDLPSSGASTCDSCGDTPLPAP